MSKDGEPPSKCSTLQLARRNVRWYYVSTYAQVVAALPAPMQSLCGTTRNALCKQVTSPLWVVVQLAISLVIIGNFVVNVMQAQLKATEENERLFDLSDIIFTSLFLVELLMNMFGTMVNEFVSDWWNWFDVVIVAVSVASLVSSSSSAQVTMQLRLFRNFRGKEISQRCLLLFGPESSCSNVTLENGQC